MCKLDFSSFVDSYVDKFVDRVVDKFVNSSCCIMYLNFSELQTQKLSCSVSQVEVSSVILHQRLGHPSQQTLTLIIKNKNMSLFANMCVCVSCVVRRAVNCHSLILTRSTTHLLNFLKWICGDLHLCHQMLISIT